MLSTPDAPDLCARTCAKTGCAQTDTANTALYLEASRRECADLKEAYSKMAASLWRAEQVIEHLEGEVAELKAGHQPPPPQPPQRKRKSSASAATTPASSPAASQGGFNEEGYSAWGFTMPGPMPSQVLVDSQVPSITALVRAM